MNINDLKVFITSAEYGSFTRAAMVNNTVQSNVSARIKYLEQELKTELFTRSTRKIILTDEGEKFLKLAKEIITSIDNFKTHVGDNDVKPSGNIKIGCLHTTAALRIPNILQNFTLKYPDVDIKLKTATTSDLLKDVLSFKLDGAFVSGEIHHPDVDVKFVIEEELCIVTSSAHPNIDKINNASKVIKLVVFNKGCVYRQILLNAMNDMAIKRIKIIEIDTLEGIINTVESGIGITILPVELISKHYRLRNLITLPLPDHLSKVPTVFIKHKNFPMSKAYSLFFKTIVNGYKQ